VFSDPVHSATKHRILPDPGLRPGRTDRHSVLGLVLDQRGRVTGTRLHRSTDRPDNDHNEWGS